MRSWVAVFVTALLGVGRSAAAGVGPGAGYYDLGVFSYEDGACEDAVEKLLRAVALEPKDPYYRHFLGKAYLCVDDPGRAVRELEAARGIDPDLPDLDLDLAEAAERLGEGASVAESDSLRENAGLAPAGNRGTGPGARLRGSAALGLGYDDNVRLAPDDLAGVAGRGDVFLSLQASAGVEAGRGALRGGLGYAHAQILYEDLSEYDFTASAGEVRAVVGGDRLAVALRYLPSFYWLDSDGYLARHALAAGLALRPSPRFGATWSYAYRRDRFLTDPGRSGHTHAGGLDLDLASRGGGARVIGAVTARSNAAVSPDQEELEGLARLGVRFRLGSRFAAGAEARCGRKLYRHEDSLFGVRRRDDRLGASLSVERALVGEWLALVAEVTLERNRSNLAAFEYDRTVTTLSLRAER